MTNGQELIQDEVVSTTERLENVDEDADLDELLDELDPLEVEYLVSGNGHVKEVIAILTVGGPHIEFNLTKGRVDGYWGGEEHSAPIFKNEEVWNRVEEYYARHFEETQLA